MERWNSGIVEWWDELNLLARAGGGMCVWKCRGCASDTIFIATTLYLSKLTIAHSGI